MIFDDAPSDWRKLEALVAQAFDEMGCKVTSDKTIAKIRSTSQIDVYVEDPTLSPPAIYLCECKHWKKPVPKRVVQQFRTIISDAGANLGIIISEKGFQSGAQEEAACTNVRLYSWHDFQKAFEERWTKTMAERLRKLACECADLAFEAYHAESSPEGDRLSRELSWDLFCESARIFKVGCCEKTVVEECQSVRFCETGPELTASQADIWVELRTKREFYDYAIPLAEEFKRKLQRYLAIQCAHPPK